MAKRRIGDAVVRIAYHNDGDYRGSVSANGRSWRFRDLHGPAIGFRFPYDSPEAYDRMAEEAVSFATYYTTHNRGDDVPPWAPSAEVADALEEATNFAMNDRGEYSVCRI
jgi:hypothetical protein